MNKIIEYLMSKKIMEQSILIVLFIFLPVYLIEFLYYREWFEEMDIIKITVLNVGIVSTSYILQMILYVGTNLVFTKKGRTINEIVLTPAVILGGAIHFTVFSKCITDDLRQVIFISYCICIIVEIIVAIISEKSLKLIET